MHSISRASILARRHDAAVMDWTSQRWIRNIRIGLFATFQLNSTYIHTQHRKVIPVLKNQRKRSLNHPILSIYTIICLKSVSLSVDVRRLQVAILARSPREISQTDRIVWQYILSRVRISVRPSIFFIREKHP